MVGDIEAVFHKVGGEGQKLLARVEYSLENCIKSTGCADADDDIAGFKVNTLVLAEPCCQRLAGEWCPGIGRVAEGERLIRCLGKGFQALDNLGRSRKIRVAQREVVYIFGTVFLAKLDTCLKHAADH